MHIAFWFVEHSNYNHNHFEGEITSYKNAWTTFAKGHFCECQKHWNPEGVSKKVTCTL
jgi:hypothetical protein